MPGNAPTGVNWALGAERRDIFDAFACRDYIAARGIKYDYGRTSVTCGLCILACPWTRKYVERNERNLERKTIYSLFDKDQLSNVMR